MKEHLFTLHGWYCWLVHSLVVLGAGAAILFLIMQWEEVYVTINLPAIQRGAHK